MLELRAEIKKLVMRQRLDQGFSRRWLASLRVY
jgi:hypothetical protein